MTCTNCFEGEYKKHPVSNHRFAGLFCQKCDICGDIVFTHKQALALDKRRRKVEARAELAGQLKEAVEELMEGLEA
mgnify:CR=1 FL=1